MREAALLVLTVIACRTPVPRPADPAVRWQVEVIGEDATSGFVHLRAWQGGRLHRARIIWNGGCCAAPTVDEYHLAAGELVEVRSWIVRRRELPALTRGADVAPAAFDRLRFRGRRLVAWSGPRARRSGSADWRDRERSHLAMIEALLRE